MIDDPDTGISSDCSSGISQLIYYSYNSIYTHTYTSYTPFSNLDQYLWFRINLTDVAPQNLSDCIFVQIADLSTWCFNQAVNAL